MNNWGEPKLTDFGLSRILDYTWTSALRSSSHSSPRGTTRWMTYELVEDGSDSDCTKESDMWAFGMVIYVSLMMVECMVG